MKLPEMNRRQFLGGASAGLVLALTLPSRALKAAAVPADAVGRDMAAHALKPNAFVVVAPDNTVTVIVKHLEMGQGAYAGLSTLVAEELDADWEQIRAVSAPADTERFKNNAFGIQGVGGSTGLANSYEQFRQAGATARTMLVQAAARRWEVDASEIRVSKGVVTHETSGQSASFGDLALDAAALPVPTEVPLKDPADFQYIGKGPLQRPDSASKTDGSALFTLDLAPTDETAIPLTAVIIRPPRFGATVESFDSAKAGGMSGVVAIQAIPQGVAVIAEDYWRARQAAAAVSVSWDNSKAVRVDSSELEKSYRKSARKPGDPVVTEGDVDAVLGKPESGAQAEEGVLDLEYAFPFLAHAAMEPMDCFVEPVTDRNRGSMEPAVKVRVALGCQMQTLDHAAAAEELGLKPENVHLDTVFAGGSFGRRAQKNSEVAREGAQVFKAAGGNRPVKLVYSREDDMTAGHYRPMYVHRLRGKLSPQGELEALDHVIVGQSIISGSPFQGMIKDGIDPTSVEGAQHIPYQTANRRLTLHTTDPGVPVLWWRSVGSTHTAYSLETFLDQLMSRAGLDPVSTRMQWMKDSPRDAAVLEAVAQAAGWRGTKPYTIDGEERAMGVAVHKSFGSYVAQIIEVARADSGLPLPRRAWCAVDCGLAVTPDVVKAQMEGGIGFGLGAILYDEITLKDGLVEQKNFDTYRSLRIHEMPKVEVVIVNSGEKPTGVGEPGVPPAMPALANAWAALTGQRVYNTPFVRSLKEQGNGEGRA